MQKISKQIVIGLQDTGKTTFLAALWHVVESGELSSCLTLEKLEGNQGYVNQLKEKWLNCESLARTPQGIPEIISMKLKDDDLKNSVEVFFPDVSGESFELQWADRKMEKKYAEFAKEASGILLFLHPEQNKKPISIDALNSMMDHTPKENNTESPPLKLWSAEDAPTQVILVDMIQSILSLNAFNNIRLAVIISAWDSLGPITQTPMQWFEQELPLLHQYLQANSPLFSVKVFGISAQGGSLDEDKEMLQEFCNSSERIKIIEENQQSSDITIPIRWIVGI